MRREAKHHLLIDRVILEFLSIFMKSQASSPFEAMNSAHLSMCQKDVRPSVQKRCRIMSFSRVSTGDSVIPSSYEMKYETAFKPLQGNLAFFWVRASRGPFHLRQKTQSPSHIPISKEVSSWGDCGKLAYLFSRRQGIILIPRWYVVHGIYLKLLYWKWWSSILEKVSQGISRGS